jgi:beta-aspartyl-dipeptidase (metallo-type)
MMRSAMTLIHNVEVFAPEPLGRSDLFLAGTKICAIGRQLKPSFPGIDFVDGTGCIALPGMVDAHVHTAGAGGEGGPATRTAELPLSSFLEAGVTTVVGCQGTDGFTRDLKALLMKTKGLKQQGLSSWMYTGAYQVPPPTILSSVAHDITLIEEVIGVGEVAIADHRSSSPTALDLIRLAKMSHTAGLLAGKSGIVHLHMGDAPDPFRQIEEAVTQSELTWKHFYPTHCNRNREIFRLSLDYGREGYVDLTTSSYEYYPEIEVKSSIALKQLLEAGVPLSHVTMTSDGGGSLPLFDADGRLTGMEVGMMKANWKEVWDAVEEGLSLDQVYRCVSSNPADILKLPGKGRLAVGFDADVLLLKDREIQTVFSRGQRLLG